jgi:hypothetical protein
VRDDDVTGSGADVGVEDQDDEHADGGADDLHACERLR